MKKGDPSRRIVNLFGDELAVFKAPADGMFFGLRALPNVTTGDWCCFFNKVAGTSRLMDAAHFEGPVMLGKRPPAMFGARLRRLRPDAPPMPIGRAARGSP